MATFNNTLLGVAFNYETDKSNAYEHYYVSGVVDIDSIDVTRCTCRLFLYDHESKHEYWEEKNFPLSFLPENLVRKNKKIGYKYAHVLVCKKIFFYSTITTMCTSMIIPIGGEKIGYFNNELMLPSAGKILLNRFFDTLGTSWASIPLPRYQTLKQKVSAITNIWRSSFYKKSA